MSIRPTLVASEKGYKGVVAAMDLLRDGGSALDAVEMACRIIEDDPKEHTVGYSGIPSILGEVELEASIMDGQSLRAGAVAGVRGYGNMISLARVVMEELPHVLVVAHGAQRLAAECSRVPVEQRTLEAMQKWHDQFEEAGVADLNERALRAMVSQINKHLNETEGNNSDTVDFLALDRAGNLASAVTTSGLGWKYPGRVGDSSVIGAGNYCDNRHGAAACNGNGEFSIRVSSARSLVLYKKMGMSLQEAGLEALRDLSHLDFLPGEYLNIVALSPDGQHAGFSTKPQKQYLYWNEEMAEPAWADRSTLP
jgi:beta-aspartyl-peptidase (threonine type)